MVKEMRFKKQIEDKKQWKSVSKEEHDAFVKNYEGKLVPHTLFNSILLIHAQYDFSINPIDGDASVCIVSKYIDGCTNLWGVRDEYHIVENIDEVKAYANEIKERLGR